MSLWLKHLLPKSVDYKVQISRAHGNGRCCMWLLICNGKPQRQRQNCCNKLGNETSQSSKPYLLIRDPTSVIKVNKSSEKCPNTKPEPTHTYKDIYTCIQTYIYIYIGSPTHVNTHLWMDTTHIYA